MKHYYTLCLFLYSQFCGALCKKCTGIRTNITRKRGGQLRLGIRSKQIVITFACTLEDPGLRRNCTHSHELKMTDGFHERVKFQDGDQFRLVPAETLSIFLASRIGKRAATAPPGWPGAAESAWRLRSQTPAKIDESPEPEMFNVALVSPSSPRARNHRDVRVFANRSREDAQRAVEVSHEGNS
jgi:hypothetical protein